MNTRNYEFPKYLTPTRTRFYVSVAFRIVREKTYVERKASRFEGQSKKGNISLPSSYVFNYKTE